MAKPAPPPPAPISGKKRGRPSWDDNDNPDRKSEAVNSKVAKTIKDKYHVNHILDAGKLALKQQGYTNASKALAFIQKDPDNNGEKVLQALDLQGMYGIFLVEALLVWLFQAYLLSSTFSVYLHYDVNTYLTSFFKVVQVRITKSNIRVVEKPFTRFLKANLNQLNMSKLVRYLSTTLALTYLT